MNRTTRIALALAAGLLLAGQASAQISFNDYPHWQENLVAPAGATAAISPDFVMTLAQPSDVTIRVGVGSPSPVVITGVFDGSFYASPPNDPHGYLTYATFSGVFGGGTHDFRAMLGLAGPAAGDTSFPVSFDFSAVPVQDTDPGTGPGNPSAVPEPANLALMLSGALGLWAAARRRQR